MQKVRFEIYHLAETNPVFDASRTEHNPDTVRVSSMQASWKKEDCDIKTDFNPYISENYLDKS